MTRVFTFELPLLAICCGVFFAASTARADCPPEAPRYCSNCGGYCCAEEYPYCTDDCKCSSSATSCSEETPIYCSNCGGYCCDEAYPYCTDDCKCSSSSGGGGDSSGSCPEGYPVNCGDGTCCPSGTTCNGDGTCSGSSGDSGGGICPEGYPVNCGNGKCCPSGTTCTADGMCQSGGDSSGGGGDDGYTCSGYYVSNAELASCDNVQACCSMTTCYYDASGTRFWCDGTYCYDAAEDLIDYCDGPDEPDCSAAPTARSRGLFDLLADLLR